MILARAAPIRRRRGPATESGTPRTFDSGRSYRSFSTSSAPITFRLVGMDGGLPDLADIRHETSIAPDTIIPTGQFPDEVLSITLDLSGAGVGVAAGDVLALAMRRDAPGAPPWVLWGSSNQSVYDGGNAFFLIDGDTDWTVSTRDLGFRTWVTVPSPGASALLTVVVALRRRRR